MSKLFERQPDVSVKIPTTVGPFIYVQWVNAFDILAGVYRSRGGLWVRAKPTQIMLGINSIDRIIRS